MKKEPRLAAHIYGLSKPLSDYCKKHNVTAAEATRIALCLLLGWKEIPSKLDTPPAYAPGVVSHDN